MEGGQHKLSTCNNMSRCKAKAFVVRLPCPSSVIVNYTATSSTSTLHIIYSLTYKEKVKLELNRLHFQAFNGDTSV